jgi:hypothetical protein
MDDSSGICDQDAELFAAYCEFKGDGLRAYLANCSDAQYRRKIAELNQPVAKSDFAQCIRELRKEPARFSQFVQMLEQGWSSATTAR